MFILFYTPSSMLGALLGILLSVTPFAPIFRLLSFTFQPSAMMLDMNNMSSVLGLKNRTDDFNNIMHQILTNETLDIEELVMSILGRDFQWAQQYHSKGSSSLFFQSPSSLPWIHHTTWDDLSEVIPWILSLLLFVIVPVVMKVSEAIRNRGLGQQFKERKLRSISTSVIEKCLRMCQKVVRKEDLISEYTDETAQESNILSVPKPGTIWDDSDRHDCSKESNRSFVGSCAVCLSSFSVGDMIVWSSNSECQDVFHESCFITWAQKKGYPTCPCCRQSFVKRELIDRVFKTSSKEKLYFNSTD